jgi:ribosome-binding ATPase YchF (GTP1/OBG family)|tara:strand:+ start:527 stop:841 length:315 start_codon:yes stop_codon:yes gene_type:complete
MDNTEMKQVYTVQSQRLDRIEEKLDQMAQAIIALARAEEKISTLAEFNKQQSEQIQSLINRIDRVEQLVNSNASTVNVINKIFWVIIVGLISAVTWEMIIHLNN